MLFVLYHIAVELVCHIRHNIIREAAVQIKGVHRRLHRSVILSKIRLEAYESVGVKKGLCLRPHCTGKVAFVKSFSSGIVRGRAHT